MSQSFAPGKDCKNRVAIFSVPEKYLGEKDTLQFLKDHNKEYNFRYVKGTLPFLVISTPAVDIIFHICHIMNQPSEVRFMAVDLFDRFMMNHFLDVKKQLDASTRNRSCKKREWKLLKTRIRKQALLRVLSCVQLASKFVLNATKLETGKLLRFLNAQGHSYSLRSVYNSEQRVLKTVNFQLPIRTPLTYVEIILECLRNKLRKELKDETNSTPPRPTLYSICVSVLDVACLQRQELFHRFFWMATNRWERTQQDRIKFLEVECDYVFFAASVILCAIHIWKNNSFLIIVANEQLSQLTQTPAKEIKGFATLISHSIFGSRTFDAMP